MSRVQAETSALTGIIDTSKKLQSEASSLCSNSISALDNVSGQINSFMQRVKSQIDRGEGMRSTCERERTEAEEARRKGESYVCNYAAQEAVKKADALKRIYPELLNSQKEFEARKSEFIDLVKRANVGSSNDVESFIKPLITILNDYAKQNFDSSSYASFRSHCTIDGDGDGNRALESTPSWYRDLGD